MFDEIRKRLEPDPERDARVEALQDDFLQLNQRFTSPEIDLVDNPRPGKRAVNNAEKAHVIFDILAVWLEHPEMRLAQLIANVYRAHPDEIGDGWQYFFNTEDYELLEGLRAYYKK